MSVNIYEQTGQYLYTQFQQPFDSNLTLPISLFYVEQFYKDIDKF